MKNLLTPIPRKCVSSTMLQKILGSYEPFIIESAFPVIETTYEFDEGSPWNPWNEEYITLCGEKRGNSVPMTLSLRSYYSIQMDLIDKVINALKNISKRDLF